MNKADKRGGIEELARASTRLFGRDACSRQLTQLLDDEAICVVGVRATGGTGKTVLVRSWLDQITNRRRINQPHVLAWKFADPGKNASGSSEGFFKEVMAGQGQATLSGSEDWSPSRKATQIEAAFQALPRPAVLVLDSLEVLQHRDDDQRGGIYDEAIRLFLVEMAEEHTKDNQGLLVVVTTREALTDLKDLGAYSEIRLPPLEEEAGAKLLQALGVIDDEGGDVDSGESKGLRAASHEYGGNPLALVLLAGMIREFSGTNAVSYRYDIQKFRRKRDADEDEDWVHARDILDYYEREARQQEDLILLKMMGLFHRSMQRPERDVLQKRWNLAAPVWDWDDHRWQDCHARLEQIGLLTKSDEPRQVWDCHPLVREHFRENLQEGAKEARDDWRQAHQVLFEYFRDQPVEREPKKRDDLLPLYRAIHHGCLAEQFSGALGVYKQRVMQGSATAFSDGRGTFAKEGGATRPTTDQRARGTNELGAVGEDSAALRMFFASGSTLLPGAVAQLSEDEQAWLQARRGFCLTCLGRLREAILHRQQELGHCRRKPRQDLSDDMRRQVDADTANAAAMLSQLMLLTGELGEAERLARDALQYAENAINPDQQVRSLCRLGGALHMRGDLKAAETAFDEAKRRQARRDRQREHLGSDHGFLYRRFLLDRCEGGGEWQWREIVLRDAQSALDQDRNEKNTWLVAIALGQLAKASAMARIARASRVPKDEDDASTVFGEAKDALRDSGSVIDFPVFLLERARFHCWLVGRGDPAEKEVDKALRYARDYGMPLYQADAHLLKAEILIKSNAAPARVRDELNKAKDLIDHHHYGNQRARLEELMAWINGPQGTKPTFDCR